MLARDLDLAPTRGGDPNDWSNGPCGAAPTYRCQGWRRPRWASACWVPWTAAPRADRPDTRSSAVWRDEAWTGRPAGPSEPYSDRRCAAPTPSSYWPRGHVRMVLQLADDACLASSGRPAWVGRARLYTRRGGWVPLEPRCSCSNAASGCPALERRGQFSAAAAWWDRGPHIAELAAAPGGDAHRTRVSLQGHLVLCRAEVESSGQQRRHQRQGLLARRRGPLEPAGRRLAQARFHQRLGLPARPIGIGLPRPAHQGACSCSMAAGVRPPSAASALKCRVTASSPPTGTMNSSGQLVSW